MKSLAFVDWFSGCGLFRLGLERAGHRCVWSCEIDDDARSVYAARFGAEPEGGKTKTPRGRSVALEATAGYCHDDCPGYEQAPKPPHFWPNERPEPEGAASPGGPRA